MSDDAAFLEINEDLEEAARDWRSVEALDEPVRDESIEEARKILRWLRNLQSTEMVLEEWLDIGTAVEQAAKAGPLAKLAKIFLRKLRKARKARPGILREDGAVEYGSHAACAMLLAVAEFFINRLTEGDAREAELEALIASLPPQAEMRQSQSVQRLIETLSMGFDRLLGKTVSGLPTAGVLAEMSHRIQSTARQLRSAHSMDPPAREESIELARDILRKLKNMSFKDKSVQELVDTGKPEDKAVFAQQIDEMVDIYRNLLAEAGQFNPNILQDQRIKEAGEAVSVFAHAVSLMAAKEMPGSIAAAQKISAEATQEPEEWKDLHHRTVDRIVKSMEGGLEKAAGDLEAQQQQQQDDDERAQDAIEAALNQADHTSRKKKRRRKRSHSSTSKSGLGGKKQRRQHMDLTADDYVLKQGAFSRDAKAARVENPPAMQGLNADALAAVRQLGGALQGIGNQLKDISASVANVTTGDKIVPDDKTKTQTHAEREKNARNQGPRV